MTAAQFREWGTALGIDNESLAELDRIAAIPLNKKNVKTDCLYSPESIVQLWQTNGMRIDPGAKGFVIIGGCANGDPIAISIIEDDRESVWYISHEAMHDGNLRSFATRVAPNVGSFYKSLCSERGFPTDYYSAIAGSRG